MFFRSKSCSCLLDRADSLPSVLRVGTIVGSLGEEDLRKCKELEELSECPVGTFPNISQYLVLAILIFFFTTMALNDWSLKIDIGGVPLVV